MYEMFKPVASYLRHTQILARFKYATTVGNLPTCKLFFLILKLYFGSYVPPYTSTFRFCNMLFTFYKAFNTSDCMKNKQKTHYNK